MVEDRLAEAVLDGTVKPGGQVLISADPEHAGELQMMALPKRRARRTKAALPRSGKGEKLVST